MKVLVRAVYFLIELEVALMTNWRSMVSTVASCGSSSSQKNFLTKCPVNAVSF